MNGHTGMIKFAIILFLLVFPQQQVYQYKHNRPTKQGIDYYVRVNKHKIQKELEDFLKDTIFLDVEISTDDISEYVGNDSLDMAYHFTYKDGGDEIILDNRERYVAYDINDLSKLRRLTLSTYNRFVKTALIHELMHSYFLQKIIMAKNDSVRVYKEYDYKQMTAIRMYPNIEEDYGASFIEEGVCQYVVQQMKQEIQYKTPIPESVQDLTGSNTNSIKYNYSVEYLRKFLDHYGVGKGIEILIKNKPPIYSEILNPELFFNRLN
jgi:hypothetical protein